jgi:hypothetical protein
MMRIALVVAGLITALPLVARAADHLNLEPDLPVTVEDAYPIPYRGRELQGFARYERESGDNLVTVQPRLELGLLPDFQLGIAVPYRFGDAEAASSGDVAVDGLYNFNTESLYLPALALAGAIDVAYGDEGLHVETEVKAIATKSLGGFVPRRLHLNLSWRHAFSADQGEREDRYRAALGYSQPVTADAVLVADLVREQQLEDNRERNLAEAGVRYQLTPLAVLTAGGGVELGTAPDFRVLVGFQYSIVALEPFGR